MKRYNYHEKLKLGLFIALCSALLFFVISPVFASAANEYWGVSSTDDSDPGSFYIGVAGNPDCYPYEYYDTTKGEYIGLFPEIYSRIYNDTGIKFIYTKEGTDDTRLMQSKLGYAQIISCYAVNDKQMNNYKLSSPIIITTATIDGKEEKLSIVFTNAADENLRQTISNAVSNISNEDISEIISKYPPLVRQRNFPYWQIIIVAIIIIAILVAVFRQLVVSLRNKKTQKGLLMDSDTGMLSREGFGLSFSELSANISDSTYYLAFISCHASILKLRTGYAITECILSEATKVIKRYISNDICSKYSSDVFTILHHCEDDQSATEWAEILIQELNNILIQNQLDNITHFSCGLYPMNKENWNLAQGIEIANGCYQDAFTHDMNVKIAHNQIQANDKANAKLLKAIEKDFNASEFDLYLQPVIDANTGEIVSAECLSRWHHPELGVLRPGQYINLLIEKNHILEHDLHQLALAAKLLEQWKKQKIDVKLSINASRLTTSDAESTQKILDTIAPYDFNRTQLIIEQAEEGFLANLTLASETSRLLTEGGLSLTLDDLTPASALFSDLGQYPFSSVKLNRETITGSDTTERVLYSGLFSTCKSMSINIVCEGVETSEQYELVKDLGADQVQGFYFFQPMSVKDFEKLIKNGGKVELNNN